MVQAGLENQIILLRHFSETYSASSDSEGAEACSDR